MEEEWHILVGQKKKPGDSLLDRDGGKNTKSRQEINFWWTSTTHDFQKIEWYPKYPSVPMRQCLCSSNHSLVVVLQAQMGDFAKVKFLGGSTLENVQHVQAGCLEVGGCIEWTGDEHLRVVAIVDGLINVRDGHKPELSVTLWMTFYFSVMCPRSCKAGWISASGFAVSTVVYTLAMYQPLGATWFELDTHEM